jgi:hypothetical protein
MLDTAVSVTSFAVFPPRCSEITAVSVTAFRMYCILFAACKKQREVLQLLICLLVTAHKKQRQVSDVVSGKDHYCNRHTLRNTRLNQYTCVSIRFVSTRFVEYTFSDSEILR